MGTECSSSYVRDAHQTHELVSQIALRSSLSESSGIASILLAISLRISQVLNPLLEFSDQPRSIQGVKAAEKAADRSNAHPVLLLARACRSRRIKAARMEWVTSAYSPKSLPRSADGAMLLDRSNEVVAARRMKATLTPHNRTQRQLIKPYSSYQKHRW